MNQHVSRSEMASDKEEPRCEVEVTGNAPKHRIGSTRLVFMMAMNTLSTIGLVSDYSC
jgi:hypothetical protein